MTRRWSPSWDRTHVRLTPAYVLDPIREAMGGTIGLDPCTEPDNPTRARHFYTLAEDGLQRTWRGLGPVWCNPPWEGSKDLWITRALEVGQAGETVALLVPAYIESRSTQALLGGAHRVVFVGGHMRFATRPPHDTHAVNGWGKGVLVALWNMDAPTGLGPVLMPDPMTHQGGLLSRARDRLDDTTQMEMQL